MKFTVDRQKWYRGNSTSSSLLLRVDGRRCCIGFVGQQCGLPDSALLNRAVVLRLSTSDSEGFYPPRPEPEENWLAWLRSSRGIAAYGINDNPRITDAERETDLKNLFQENGDEIEFVG